MANFIIGQILFIGEAQNLTSQNTGNSFTKRSLIISVRRFDPNTGEPVNAMRTLRSSRSLATNAATSTSSKWVRMWRSTLT